MRNWAKKIKKDKNSECFLDFLLTIRKSKEKLPFGRYLLVDFAYYIYDTPEPHKKKPKVMELAEKGNAEYEKLENDEDKIICLEKYSILLKKEKEFENKYESRLLKFRREREPSGKNFEIDLAHYMYQ